MAFAGGSLNVVGLPKRKTPWTKTKTTNRIFRGNLRVTYGNTLRFGTPGLAIIFLVKRKLKPRICFEENVSVVIFWYPIFEFLPNWVLRNQVKRCVWKKPGSTLIKSLWNQKSTIDHHQLCLKSGWIKLWGLQLNICGISGSKDFPETDLFGLGPRNLHFLEVFYGKITLVFRWPKTFTFHGFGGSWFIIYWMIFSECWWVHEIAWLDDDKGCCFFHSLTLKKVLKLALLGSWWKFLLGDVC